jgi:hypothetical protein
VWDVQTFQEFAKLSTKLTDGAFLFTGLELFESLSSKQLSTLLRHPWQGREKELDAEVDDPEIQDEDGNRNGFITMLAPDKAVTLLEERIQKQEQQDAEIQSKTLHHVTESQKKSLETVSFFCKEMCVILNLGNNQLAENQADKQNHTFDPFDVTNLPHTMEVLRLKLTSYLKGLVEEHQRQDPNYKPSGAHIQLHEHTFRLKNIRGGMAWYGLMLELTRKEKLLRRILSDQVCKCVCVRMRETETDTETERKYQKEQFSKFQIMSLDVYIFFFALVYKVKFRNKPKG